MSWGDPHHSFIYRVDEDLVVKVGDFGLAREVYISKYYRVDDKTARLPWKWMAPESFNDDICTEKTDVVSTPVMLMVMLACKSYIIWWTLTVAPNYLVYICGQQILPDPEPCT